MSDSIYKIGANCFYGCKNLRKVKLSNNLKEIEIPKSVQRMSLTAFNKTGIERLEIPYTVHELTDYLEDTDEVSIKEIEVPRILESMVIERVKKRDITIKVL